MSFSPHTSFSFVPALGSLSGFLTTRKPIWFLVGLSRGTWAQVEDWFCHTVSFWVRNWESPLSSESNQREESEIPSEFGPPFFSAVFIEPLPFLARQKSARGLAPFGSIP